MRYFFTLSILALTALMTSCATLNESECLSADWYVLGLTAGSRGETRELMGRQHKDCLQHGITLDRTAWLEGYDYGLDDFCTASSGYAYGNRGQTYQGVCPRHLEGDFVFGYQQGKLLYDAEQEVKDINRDLKRQQSQMEDVERRLDRYQYVLADSNSNEADRKRAHSNVVDLRREASSLRREIRDLNYRRDAATNHLMRIRAQDIHGW